MKLKKLLISACLLVGMSSLSFGQTNLMANWAGPGGTGAGTPAEYGWGVRQGDGSEDNPTTPLVAWNTANASSGVRFRDVNASTSPVSTMENGSTFAGRILYLRWDAGQSTVNYVFHYPVMLQAGRTYDFSMMYQWWSNGTLASTDYTVSASRDMAGTDNLATATFTVSDRNVMRTGALTFTAPTTGTYYMTFKTNNSVLGGFSNFSLVARTTGVRNELNGNSGYAMYPNPASRESGLYLAERNSSNESVQLYIYSSAGKLQKQVKVAASDKGRIDISDLAAGLYIAKVVTKKGTFNKTIVVQ